VRSTFEDPFTLLLSDASENAEFLPFPRGTPELLETMENLLFRFIANAARVVQNQLGLLGAFYLRIALLH
jgi:hypothetical protein